MTRVRIQPPNVSLNCRVSTLTRKCTKSRPRASYRGTRTHFTPNTFVQKRLDVLPHYYLSLYCASAWRGRAGLAVRIQPSHPSRLEEAKRVWIRRDGTLDRVSASDLRAPNTKIRLQFRYRGSVPWHTAKVIFTPPGAGSVDWRSLF
jgi:hypothetical protein